MPGPDDRLQSEAHAAVVQGRDGLYVEAGLLGAGATSGLGPRGDGGVDRSGACALASAPSAAASAFRHGCRARARSLRRRAAAPAHAVAGLDRGLRDHLDEAAGRLLDLLRRAADEEDGEAVAGIADEMPRRRVTERRRYQHNFFRHEPSGAS